VHNLITFDGMLCLPDNSDLSGTGTSPVVNANTSTTIFTSTLLPSPPFVNIVTQIPWSENNTHLTVTTKIIVGVVVGVGGLLIIIVICTVVIVVSRSRRKDRYDILLNKLHLQCLRFA